MSAFGYGHDPETREPRSMKGYTDSRHAAFELQLAAAKLQHQVVAAARTEARKRGYTGFRQVATISPISYATMAKVVSGERSMRFLDLVALEVALGGLVTVTRWGSELTPMDQSPANFKPVARSS